MSAVITTIAVIVSSCVLGILVCLGLEWLELARWKLKRCPSCRRRLAFAGWDLSEWHKGHVLFCTYELNGETLEIPVDAVICPHCGFQIWVGEAAHFH